MKFKEKITDLEANKRIFKLRASNVNRECSDSSSNDNNKSKSKKKRKGKKKKKKGQKYKSKLNKNNNNNNNKKKVPLGRIELPYTNSLVDMSYPLDDRGYLH